MRILDWLLFNVQRLAWELGRFGKQPRRAILYIAWGEEHLGYAADSARSAAFMGIPAILYTDHATAAMVPEDAPFDRIVPLEMTEYGHLAKFYVVENLPRDFDSFLYLDVDSRVIKDLSFAFEMAERYGLAMAPATHYSLDHFHGFGRVMDHVGFPRRGQLLYNAGAIFFTLSPGVRRVFALWKELSYRLIEETGFKRTDQPFLTLAIEMLRYNPYTLAPTYNYRALAGEILSGEVYLWHSYADVPEDVNDFEVDWPPRAFYGSRAVKPWE